MHTPTPTSASLFTVVDNFGVHISTLPLDETSKRGTGRLESALLVPFEEVRKHAEQIAVGDHGPRNGHPLPREAHIHKHVGQKLQSPAKKTRIAHALLMSARQLDERGHAIFVVGEAGTNSEKKSMPFFSCFFFFAHTATQMFHALQDDVLLHIYEIIACPTQPNDALSFALVNTRLYALFHDISHKLRLDFVRTQNMCSKFGIDPPSTLRELEELDIPFVLTPFDMHTVHLLFRKGCLQSIRRLNVDCNNIGNDGLRVLSSGIKGAPACAMTHISFAKNNIGDDGMSDFCNEVIASGRLTALVSIRFQRNAIGDVSMQRLSECAVPKHGGPPPLANLQTVCMCGNRIGDAGIVALARAIERNAFPKLHTMYMHDNPFGDVGAKEIINIVLASKQHHFKCIMVPWHVSIV